MIEEEYVSFEVAKLLEKKGFQAYIDLWYDEDGELFWKLGYEIKSDWRVKQNQKVFRCPTQQMAMRWLREVHNLCIEPYRTASGYLYTISKIWTGSELYSDEFNGDDEASGQWTTWEKAVEAAIRYCLKNLI